MGLPEGPGQESKKAQHVNPFTTWWQLKYVVFSLPILKERIPFDKHVFQMGWFNHQLGEILLLLFHHNGGWSMNPILTVFFPTSVVSGATVDGNQKSGINSPVEGKVVYPIVIQGFFCTIQTVVVVWDFFFPSTVRLDH